MLRKRGLSDIVTTLLIILLTVVAIAIIWMVVRNIIQKGSEDIELGQFTLDLEIESVSIGENNVTVVVVRRNPGEGELIGMNFVFSDGLTSETIRKDVALNESDTRSFTLTLTKIGTNNLKEVSIYPIYKTTSGNEAVGNIADKYEFKATAGTGGTGGVVSEGKGGNFEKLGFVGTGKYETISISGSEGVWPQFKSAVVDPLDVRLGANQTFTAVVYSPYGIASVATTTQLDNETLNLALEKISGDSGGETWSATWIVYDTHIEVYRTTFIATDNMGNQDSMTLTWTDACTNQFVHGQSVSTISTDCTITTLSGADNSKIVIDGATLTLSTGGTVVFVGGAYGFGKPVNGGHIVLAGGKGKKGYLYYDDDDGDGYGDNTSAYTFNALSSMSGKLRASTVASSTPDCLDSNSSVYPFQLTFFTTSYLNSSSMLTYDYNCDDSLSYRYPVVGELLCSNCSKPSGSLCVRDATGSANPLWWNDASVTPPCGTQGSVVNASNTSCILGSVTQACR